MIPVLSHTIPIGDVLSHEGCGNSFHYLALRWTLDYNKDEARAVLREKPIPVLICPKCHLDNESEAASKVAALIFEKVMESVTPKEKTKE